MPTWLQYFLGAAALLTAFGVIWTKLLRPGAKMITLMSELLPLLTEFAETFKDTPHAFNVLDEIIAQFRTDSGSSLRDVVNRIEEAARVQQVATERAAAVSESLKVGVEAAKLLAGLDRDKLQTLALLIDRVGVKVDAGVATGLRNEAHAAGVAEDLAAAHARADATTSNQAGAAADAAMQSAEIEK